MTRIERQNIKSKHESIRKRTDLRTEAGAVAGAGVGDAVAVAAAVVASWPCHANAAAGGPGVVAAAAKHCIEPAAIASTAASAALLATAFLV